MFGENLHHSWITSIAQKRQWTTELLFSRKMRTKLPDLRDESLASEMQDRDGEMKAKAKQYAVKRRNAQESDLTPGDKVLVRQE